MTQNHRQGRRKFIKGASAIIVAGIAGCADDGGDGSIGGDGGDDGGGGPELLSSASESYDINEDYYQYLPFTPSQPVTLSYEAEVRGDVRIDIILTDETNFGYFEDRTEWEYYPEGSSLDTIYASNEVELGADRTYYLIFDNTDRGSAAPPSNFDNDRVEVDVRYELYSIN